MGHTTGAQHASKSEIQGESLQTEIFYIKLPRTSHAIQTSPSDPRTLPFQARHITYLHHACRHETQRLQTENISGTSSYECGDNWLHTMADRDHCALLHEDMFLSDGKTE